MINKDQASQAGLWASVLFIMPFVWTFFIEPRIVWSESLAPIEGALSRLEQNEKEQVKIVRDIQIALLEIRIEIYSERYHVLELKEQDNKLSSSEYLMLIEYRDVVEMLKRRLERLK